MPKRFLFKSLIFFGAANSLPYRRRNIYRLLSRHFESLGSRVNRPVTGNDQLEKTTMRSILCSALLAAGLALAASTAASAAPAAGLDGAANFSAIEQVQYGPHCRRITTCHRGEFGRRICRTERICGRR
jgi:hypothetical protein